MSIFSLLILSLLIHHQPINNKQNIIIKRKSEVAMIDGAAAAAEVASAKKLALNKDIVSKSLALIDAMTKKVKENAKEAEENVLRCKDLQHQLDSMASDANHIKSLVSAFANASEICGIDTSSLGAHVDDAARFNRMNALQCDLEQARMVEGRLKSRLKLTLQNLKLTSTTAVLKILDEMTKSEKVALDCKKELADGNTMNRICFLFDGGGGNPMYKYTPLSFREFLMLTSPLLDALGMQYAVVEYVTDEDDCGVGFVTPINGFPISDGALYMLDAYLQPVN
jgi:hypothetical protein